MNLDTMRDLLTRWGRWAASDGTQRRAKTTSTIAERIGGDSYDTDFVPDIDPDVLRVDDLIKGLSGVLREAVRIAYRVPGPLKGKLPATITRTAHAERVKAAQIELLRQWEGSR